jgi:hypothetical protein
MLDSSPPSQPESGLYVGLPAELAPAGSYDRLSSLSPTHDSFSPENQRRLNHDAAVRNGEHIVPEFEFSDLDISGRKNVYRPGFEKAIRTLLDGRIKTLYVAKLDRLTRRGMGHVGLILDELERVGGRIVFVAEGLDTSKPGARQVIAILAEQARAESDAISWRIGQWHAHNRRMGRGSGRLDDRSVTWWSTGSSSLTPVRLPSCDAWSRSSSTEVPIAPLLDRSTMKASNRHVLPSGTRRREARAIA